MEQWTQQTEDLLASILGKMDLQELESMADSMQPLLASQEKNPLIHIVPHDKQLEFLSMKKREAFFFGGNNTGKSFIGAFVAACYLTGEDPLGVLPYPVPAPTRKILGQKGYTKVWLGCVKIPKGVETIKQNLLPMLPKGSVKRFDQTDGVLEMNNGAILYCMSYEAQAQAWASDAVDLIWLDEIPPWPKYEEARARVVRRNGRIIVTVTPVEAKSAWMYWEVVKNVEENPDIGYLFASVDDNPYMDELARERIKRAFKGKRSEAARLEGKFEFMTGVVHWCFDHNRHVIEKYPIREADKREAWEKKWFDLRFFDPLYPKTKAETTAWKNEWSFVRVFDLHRRSPNVCTFAAIKRNAKKIVVFAEYSNAMESIGSFAQSVRERTKELGLIEDDILVNILDESETKSPREGETTLVQEMAANGIAGMLPDRSIGAGIDRFNDYLQADDAFYVGAWCTDHISSTEDLRWQDWKDNAADEKEDKQEVTTKNNHWIRNIHFLCLYMPSMSVDRDALETAHEHPKGSPQYCLNMARRAALAEGRQA